VYPLGCVITATPFAPDHLSHRRKPLLRGNESITVIALMKYFLLPVAMLLALAGTVHAQVVWQNTVGGIVSGNYTGADTDISINGTFVAAVTENVNAGTYPIVVSDRGTTFDENSDSYITNIGGGGEDGSGSTSSNYKIALNGCAYAYTPNSYTFTLTGLNANDEYQVEIWNVANDASRTTEYSSTGPAGTTSIELENGFVFGTISGETSQSITVQGLNPGGVGEINAVALRDLGAIPEPSTYAMLFGGLGMLGLVSRYRRKLTA
jgi:hypothetical protein